MLNRSYLFIPGDSEKKLAKAQSLGADALILCLEDAVADSNKAMAREMTRDYLLAHRTTTASELWVRVNALDTEHILADLVAIMAAAPTGIFLPKPSCGDDVKAVDNYLTVLEQQNGVEVGSTKILSGGVSPWRSQYRLFCWRIPAPQCDHLGRGGYGH